MRICIDCRMWGCQYAGIGRYTQEIVLYLLLNRSWDFTLLTSECSHEELCSFKFANNLNNVYLKKCSSGLFSVWAQFELISKIPSCDILWIPSINIPLLPTRANRLITTIHDVFHLAHPEYYSRFKLSILKGLITKAVKKSSTILTVSDFSVNEIIKFYGDNVKEKLYRVYNGFNDVKFQRRIVFDDHFKYMLFVGSVKPHKNLKNALLAYENSIKSDEDFRFVIVGKKEGFITADHDIDIIVKRINIARENVIFTGSVDDDTLYSIYESASAFIMPSYYEGFGIPLIEAMFFKLPIICSNIEVFHELCGNQVSYFTPCDIDSSCKKIEEVKGRPHKDYLPWRKWDRVGEEVANLIEKSV